MTFHHKIMKYICHSCHYRTSETLEKIFVSEGTRVAIFYIPRAWKRFQSNLAPPSLTSCVYVKKAEDLKIPIDRDQFMSSTEKDVPKC